MPNVTKVAIHGAAGRMGQRLIALGSVDDELQIVAALDAPHHPKLGEDAGLLARVRSIGVPLSSEIRQPVDVVIDFSVPAGAMSILKTCVAKKIPLVLATTGFTAEEQNLVQEAAKKIPLLWSPSMSMTVNLAMRLSEIAGRALAEHPSGADVEIIERHHRFKEDAPSGTALKFGELIANAMGIDKHQHGREGRPGQRPHNEIGYHAVRTGDNPGEHTIIFGLLGETLELTVRASNRDCYAHGALTAAKFLAGKPIGIYSMNDVLGL
jgi:4-hydroxy-tetrahydrodipicolinate reductase